MKPNPEFLTTLACSFQYSQASFDRHRLQPIKLVRLDKGCVFYDATLSNKAATAYKLPHAGFVQQELAWSELCWWAVYPAGDYVYGHFWLQIIISAIKKPAKTYT
jgi:hypothetical protein